MSLWLIQSRRPSAESPPPPKSKYFTTFALFMLFTTITTIAQPPPSSPPPPPLTLPPPLPPFPPLSPLTPPPPVPAFEFPPLPPFPPLPDLPPFSASAPPPPPPKPLSPPDNTWPPPSQPQPQLQPVQLLLGCILALTIVTSILTLMMYNRLHNPPQGVAAKIQDPNRLPVPVKHSPEREEVIQVNTLELKKLPDPVVLEQPNWPIRETGHNGAGLDHTVTTIYSDW